MATGQDILTLAKQHIGQQHIFGAFIPKNNGDWKGPWNSAEFVSWCIYQTSEKIYGCDDNSLPPDRARASTRYFMRDAQETGEIISIGEAAATPGALLLRIPISGRSGMIAISDGEGGTIESSSSQTGINRGMINGRRWDFGLKLPWISYKSAPPMRYTPPDFVYRVRDPFIYEAIVGEIQTELLHRGFDPGPIDNFYGYMTEAAVRAFQLSLGLVVDGEVGDQTAKALGLELDLEVR